MYRGKVVATRDDAIRLARTWLDRQNKETANTRFIDTTDHPERYGYTHEPVARPEKSAKQLDAEIAEALAREPRS